MKKAILVTVMVLFLSAAFFSLAAAEPTAPQGDCAPGWHLHEAMPHDGQHPDHRHVGNDRDFNGDGWVCGKHVGADGSIHVHTDNNIRR